jgi:hypothetical protein
VRFRTTFRLSNLQGRRQSCKHYGDKNLPLEKNIIIFEKVPVFLTPFGKKAYELGCNNCTTSIEHFESFFQCRHSINPAVVQQHRHLNFFRPLLLKRTFGQYDNNDGQLPLILQIMFESGTKPNPQMDCLPRTALIKGKVSKKSF